MYLAHVSSLVPKSNITDDRRDGVGLPSPQPCDDCIGEVCGAVECGAIVKDSILQWGSTDPVWVW